jgi:LysM repeat protein
MKRLPRLLVATAALVAVATAAAPGWGPYVVRSGDTLWGLARQHHTSVRALQQQNHISGSLIYIGQTINVPGNGAPATAQVRKAVPVKAPVVTYTVRSGDTLTAVAAAHHATVAALASANHLSGALTIFIGQHLRLPAAPVAVLAAKAQAPAYVPLIAASATRLAAVATPSAAQIRAMVTAEAKRQGLDPALALAIADQESGYSQRMVSATDAVGVMQLMASTATWLTQYTHEPLNRYAVADNIRGGVTLLKILRSQASVPDSIAGYYQGIASVRAHGMYTDTKAYVANVQALMKRVG